MIDLDLAVNITWLEASGALGKTKDVKARFKKEQPVIDIQRQLKGLSPPEADAALGTEDFVFAGRSHVIEALLREQECERRVKAIKALKALCNLQEGRRPYLQARPTSKTKPNRDERSTAVLRKTSLSESIECKPTQCIFCLGFQELPTEQRLKPFHSTSDPKIHFQRNHLGHHPQRSVDRISPS